MSAFARLGDRLGVGVKIGLLLGLMLAVATVNVGAVYHYQSEASTLGNSVNYAGQQRMLSQRMARYANNYAQSGSPEAREALAGAADKFSRNIEILREGGTINGDRLRPAPESVRDELQQEAKLWEAYLQNVEVLLRAEPDSPEFAEALSYVRSNSDKLLSVSDDATGAFAAASTSKIAFMQRLLLGLLALDVAVFVLGTYFARQAVGRPIRELTSVADDLAAGRLDTTVSEEVSVDPDPPVADEDLRDELTLLAQSFDNLDRVLQTVAGQADALAEQEFDDPVLDEDVPGQFGSALGRMQTDLESLVTELSGLNDRLQSEAATHSEVMNRAADGDLTQRMDTDSENEAMRRIAASFNEMMAQLEATVAEIGEFADEVADASREANASVNEVRDASERVSESIQQIATGAETQRDSVEEVSRELQSLSGTIEEVASSADGVAATADDAAELGERGRESAAEAVEEMTAIQTESEDAVQRVESLADEIEEISEVTDLIADVADRTNLLALNASIEAARAGAAGEGFGVVADEIKSLAEETAEATDRIDRLVEGIQSATDDTVTDIRTVSERVADGTATVEESVEALDTIADRVADANDGIQEISDATADQATSTEEVVATVDDVAGVATQTSEEAETVSAAAEQQATAIGEVSDEMDGLTERGSELRSLVAEFETERTESVQSPTAEAHAPTTDD